MLMQQRFSCRNSHNTLEVRQSLWFTEISIKILRTTSHVAIFMWMWLEKIEVSTNNKWYFLWSGNQWPPERRSVYVRNKVRQMDWMALSVSARGGNVQQYIRNYTDSTKELKHVLCISLGIVTLVVIFTHKYISLYKYYFYLINIDLLIDWLVWTCARGCCWSVPLLWFSSSFLM